MLSIEKRVASDNIARGKEREIDTRRALPDCDAPRDAMVCDAVKIREGIPVEVT